MIKYFIHISIIILALLLPKVVLAQPLFEDGYYIDLDNNRVEGLIDRSNLHKHSVSINFKRSRRDSLVVLTPLTVKKIEVSGLRLESYQVQIDTTAKIISRQRQPAFETKQVFLEKLVDGEISLFEYTNSGISLYFIQTGKQQTPTQLIYKQYNGTNGLYNNNTFRDQLDAVNTCSEYKTPIEDINYKKTSLVKYVEYINSCNNYFYSTYRGIEMHSPRYLNISVITGLRWSKVTLSEVITSDELIVWKDLGLGNLGIEFEYLLPSTKNQFAPLVRLELARSSDNSIIDLPLGTQYVEKHLDYLFLSFALRGYLTTKTSVKLFADVGIATPIVIQDGISLTYEKRPDFSYSSNNWTPTVGFGVVLYNRFSLESKLEFIDRKMSDYTDFNHVTYTAFTLNLKLFLKSYYSVWDK